MQFLYNTQEEGGKSIPVRIRDHWASHRWIYVRCAEFSLVAVIFFGLGTIYAWDIAAKRAPIRVIEPQAHDMQAFAAGIAQRPSEGKVPAQTATAGDYVASKNGAKYYPKGCSNRIAEKNKIYFTTARDAEKAGYALAKNCSHSSL